MSTIFSKASEVAAELATRLSTITIANGFETDIGLKLFRGRRNIDDQAVPCAMLIEGNDQVSSRAGRTNTYEIVQGYVLGGYVPCDPDNPNDAAHALLRDLKKAVFKDENLGRKVKKVNYTGRDIGPRTDGVAIVMAIIEITVEYVEDVSNP